VRQSARHAVLSAFAFLGAGTIRDLPNVGVSPHRWPGAARGCSCEPHPQDRILPRLL